MISLCILSYNRLNFLKESIRSAVATAGEPLEIVVHDDGSGDPLIAEYLKELVLSGGVSHVILNPRGHNEGQGTAVNRMFAMAKGDVLVKADQDLVYKPGWVTAIREAFAENVAVCERWIMGEGDTEPESIAALGLFKYRHPPVKYEDTLIRCRKKYDEVTDFCGSLIAIPRGAWERFGPWEERSPAFAEDANFKRRITQTPGFCCALTSEDYVTNRGFGIGPSTVVPAEGQVAEIKDGPKLVTTIKR